MELWASFPPLTLGLLALILMLSVYFVGPGYNSHSATQSPAILTSIGIFGTFLGVALGLLEFDPANISASVPLLIDGLKTAFWTSIGGLLGALSVKLRHLSALMGQRRKQETFHTATVTDLANVLTDIYQTLNDVGAGGLRSEIVALKHAETEAFSSMHMQLKQYQTEMAEANAKALVVALEKVMRDFNAEINTQYGDNFRELNSAVGKMLQWQENYKSELEALLAGQSANGRLLDKAAEAYREMVGHADVFNTVSQSLGQMLAGTKVQSEQMAAYLEQLANVSERAAKSLPDLGARIDSLTTNLSANMLQSQQQVSHTLEQSVQQLAATSTQVHTTLSALAKNSDVRLAEHLEKIQNGLEQELVQSLKTFGYQMTSLSEKFVNDYAPLTERLRTLIHLAEKLGPQDAKPQQRSRSIAE